MSDEARLAAAIAAGLFGGPAGRTTHVAGRGTVNRVFVVDSPGRRVVVRLSDRAEAADEYAKEAWCIGRAAALGIPVPEVLGAGRRGRHAYMVESFVEGVGR